MSILTKRAYYTNAACAFVGGALLLPAVGSRPAAARAATPLASLAVPTSVAGAVAETPIGGWPERAVTALALTALPVAAPGSDLAYGVVSAYPNQGVYGRLVAINLVTGTVVRGPLVFDYEAQLVEVGSTLGVLEPTVMAVVPAGTYAAPVASYWTLHRIEPGTVRLAVGKYLRALGKRTNLPTVGSSQGATVDGLWAVHAGRLLLLDPATGAVKKSIPAPPGPLNAISLSPDGRLLYVSAEPQSTSVRLYELSSATGKVLGERTLEQGVPFGYVDAATSSGVFVGQSGGMSTHWVSYFSASGLTELTPPLGSGSNRSVDYAVTVLGGVPWGWSTQSLSCLSPRTGAVRATFRIPSSSAARPYLAPFALRGHVLYATRNTASPSRFSDVVELTPPAACFG